MKRIRIFISSVQSEFAQERAMLGQYIRQDALLGKFFETFLFEDVPANEASPQQVYLSEVEMSDIYLGLDSKGGTRYRAEDVCGCGGAADIGVCVARAFSGGEGVYSQAAF